MVSKFISNKNLKIDLKKYKDVSYDNPPQESGSTNCQSPSKLNSSYSKSPIRKIPTKFQNENFSDFDSPKSPHIKLINCGKHIP